MQPGPDNRTAPARAEMCESMCVCVDYAFLVHRRVSVGRMGIAPTSAGSQPALVTRRATSARGRDGRNRTSTSSSQMRRPTIGLHPEDRHVPPLRSWDRRVRARRPLKSAHTRHPFSCAIGRAHERIAAPAARRTTAGRGDESMLRPENVEGRLVSRGGLRNRRTTLGLPPHLGPSFRALAASSWLVGPQTGWRMPAVPAKHDGLTAPVSWRDQTARSWMERKDMTKPR
jgi:hypothetical protein